MWIILAIIQAICFLLSNGRFHPLAKILKGCDASSEGNCAVPKGQLISKANCQAEDSSKKRTNEFVFTSMRRVFVRFLEESSARKKRFKII